MVNLYLLQLGGITKNYDFGRKRSIRCLVVGGGVGVPSMIDNLLEHAQLPHFFRPFVVQALPIIVDVFCPKANADDYVKDRPSLKQFVSLVYCYDGNIKKLNPRPSDPWGMVVFRPLDDKYYRSEDSWDRVLSKTLCFTYVSPRNESGYGLVRLLKRVRTNAVHNVLRQSISALDWSIYDEGDYYEQQAILDGESIELYDPNAIVGIPKKVGEMAKRVDNLWLKYISPLDPNRKSHNVTILENNYYHSASLSFVCALPDLLRSLNPNWDVDISRNDNSELAAQYRTLLNNDRFAEEAMIVALHRRSDIHKLCRRWGSTNNVDAAVRYGSTKFPAKREHLWISHSKYGSPLSDRGFLKRIVSGRGSQEDWSRLDPLDQKTALYIAKNSMVRGIPLMEQQVVKDNDRFIVRNIPYILTGDDSKLDRTLRLPWFK